VRPASEPSRRMVATGVSFCECEAVSRKMYTFASAISPFESRRYTEFMSTLVYRIEKAVFSQIKYLTSKNVYFRLLLPTFHIRRRGVSFGINELTATDA
jgi:hypothetical protein